MSSHRYPTSSIAKYGQLLGIQCTMFNTCLLWDPSSSIQLIRLSNPSPANSNDLSPFSPLRISNLGTLEYTTPFSDTPIYILNHINISLAIAHEMFMNVQPHDIIFPMRFPSYIPIQCPWTLLNHHQFSYNWSVLLPGFTAAQLQGTRKAFDQVRAGATAAARSLGEAQFLFGRWVRQADTYNTH
jgi:hypothetical protein